jgi:hypothetical protein
MLKHSFLYLIPIVIALLLSACGPDAPSEAEMQEKIVGSYCNADYTLVISEDGYKCTKYRRGIVSNAINIESCEGGYDLALEDSRWVIRFAKDENPRGIANCKQEYTLWTLQEGFLIGDAEIKMKEPIDNTELPKGACE